jgi:hypothetical protein
LGIIIHIIKELQFIIPFKKYIKYSLLIKVTFVKRIHINFFLN